MAIAIGIDFGSSLCRTAVFRDGKAEVFPNRFSERKLPVIVEEVDGVIAFTTIKQRLGFAETVPSAADLFQAIRQDAKEAIGEEIEAAVVTVPACFTERQRAALRKAAEEGGFGAVRLLDEAMAGLLASQFKPEIRTVLAYALGAGVFSASLFQMGPGGPRALWHEGDRGLGGNNFDAALVTLLLRRLGFAADQFIDRQESAEKLKQLAENVKIGLSKRESEQFDVNVGELFNEAAVKKSQFSVTVTLTRADLEGVLAGMIEETIHLAGLAVEGANLDAPKIDAVFLLGDSTRIPLVEKRLRAAFPAEIVRASAAAIARGAAIHGSQLDDKAWEREKTHAPAPPERVEEAAAPESWAAQFSPAFDNAFRLWRAGQQDMAIAAVEQVQTEIPKFLAKLCSIRGMNLFRQGDFAGAMQHLEKSLKFDKDERSTQKIYHEACNRRAIELTDERKYLEAKMVIRKGAAYVRECENCARLLLRIEKEMDRARRGGEPTDWTTPRKRRR